MLPAWTVGAEVPAGIVPGASVALRWFFHSERQKQRLMRWKCLATATGIQAVVEIVFEIRAAGAMSVPQKNHSHHRAETLLETVSLLNLFGICPDKQEVCRCRSEWVYSSVSVWRRLDS